MSDCRLFASSAPIRSRGGGDEGLMVVGGSMQKKNILSTVEVFDGISWKMDSSLPLPHPGPELFFLGYSVFRQLGQAKFDNGGSI
jgi:hypothetical protein